MSALPLPVLLARLSGELTALHHMAAEIEATIDDMVESDRRPLDAQSIRNLQLLDILNQSLHALSAFAANVALLSAPDWVIDATATATGLTLAGIAQRLTGTGDQHPPAETASYELFSDG